MLIPITSTEHWHDLRSKTIGGSDVASCFGESPYLSRYKLWHIKAGLLPADDLSENERIQAGNYMEPAILAWANDKWGCDFERRKVYAQHDKITGMGSTPDAFSVSNDKMQAQIKNADSLQWRLKWQADGDTITDAPLHILLQCQHEMACTGATQCWLIVCVGGNSLYRMIIDRRESTIRMIESAVVEFWASIASGIAPQPDFKLDYDTIARLNAAGIKGKTLDLTGSNRLPSLLDEYAMASKAARAWTNVAEVTRGELLHMCGDAEVITWGDIGFKITTVKASKDRVIKTEDVGSVIPGRSSSRRIKIPKKPKGDEDESENESED